MTNVDFAEPNSVNDFVDMMRKLFRIFFKKFIR